MSKTCLRISFAVILTLFVVNLNANPKPKADNGIDIIINRVGPMVGPRMLGLRKSWKVNKVEPGPKPGTIARDWATMPKNPRPKEVERPAILPASKPAAKRAKKLMKGARWSSPDAAKKYHDRKRALQEAQDKFGGWFDTEDYISDEHFKMEKKYAIRKEIIEKQLVKIEAAAREALTMIRRPL